jgi:hypothetical protein
MARAVEMAVTGKKYCPPSIPEGYSTLSESHKRIRDKWGWGNPDGLRRFIRYLIQGTLAIYLSDQSGVNKCRRPEIWDKPEYEKYLADPDDLYSGWKMWSLTSELLFLTSELDAVLSTVEQQAERKSASAVPTSNDAASTIDATYEGSPEDELIPVKSGAIRDAIMQVYACAEKQNTAIPNNRDMCKFVNRILERKRGIAKPTLVEKLASEVRAKHDVRGGRYQQLFRGPGDTAARKKLAPSRKLVV